MERFPKPVVEADFQSASLIIARDEDEHRLMIRSRFPEWENKIAYWLVHDLDQWNPRPPRLGSIIAMVRSWNICGRISSDA